MAVSDLGGLGAREGAPVAYNWALPNLLPAMLPWLAILLLLLLKPNRCAQAWWIWVPVACVAIMAAVLQSEAAFVPSSQREILSEAFNAAGFGLAAVWLVASYLGWRHRALAWVGTLLALGTFSLLAFSIKQAVEGFGPELVGGWVLLGAGALVISVAITLASLACRGREGVIRLCLWLGVALLGVWLLLIGPLALAAMIFSRGGLEVAAVAGVIVSLAAASFAAMLPFLVLAFANAFYGTRLKGLLHLGRDTAPPVLGPPLSTASAAAGP